MVLGPFTRAPALINSTAGGKNKPNYPAGACVCPPLNWNGRSWAITQIKLNGAEQVGDVVLRRADGYVAYHLATAVDELWMGINTVVRGSDLWVSTGPQVALMQMLGQTAPQYWHLPLLLDNQGNKLAKRDRALGVASWQAQGGSAAQLIGKWAAQNGWIAPGSSISAQELLEELKNKPKNFSLKALKQQLL